MRIVIVGGGKLGRDLADTMLSRRHHVSLIEQDRQKCIKLSSLLNLEIICGDGTQLETLEEAGTRDCDIFIAVTGSDPNNLVATQLAQREFHAKKGIARANNPANAQALRVLGIENVVNGTELIADLIEREVELNRMHLVSILNKGKAGIFSVILPLKSKLDGKTLQEVTLPKGSLIVTITRNGKMVIPNGKTTFASQDEVLVVCENGCRNRLEAILTET